MILVADSVAINPDRKRCEWDRVGEFKLRARLLRAVDFEMTSRLQVEINPGNQIQFLCPGPRAPLNL